MLGHFVFADNMLTHIVTQSYETREGIEHMDWIETSDCDPLVVMAS